MRRFIWTGVGAIGTGIAVFAFGMALPSVVGISQAEGAYAMSVAFVWTPLAILIGAVLGFVFAGRKP